MKQPFLSIIVPVYNALPCLGDCLESIIGQKFNDMEIILVDDGSVDGSQEMCRSYAKKYGHIRLIQQENSGALKARQTGMANALGRYIGFVDADDWIEPEMYAYLCSAAQLNKASIVVCDYVKQAVDITTVRGFSGRPGLYDADTYENQVLLNLFCSPHRFTFSPLCTQWNTIVASDTANQELALLPEALLLGEDTAFIMGCALSINRLVYINEPLYHYRIHQNSVMHRDWCCQPEKLSQQRALLYSYLRRQSKKIEICHTFGQLESYMLFVVMFDLRSFFTSADKSFTNRYLDAPWLIELLKREQSNSQPQHWGSALSALAAKLDKRSE